MKTCNIDYATLRRIRDFLGLLAESTPDEATDLLTNHGEDALAALQVALGDSAFIVGENVLAFPVRDVGSEFAGTVAAVRRDTDGTPLFTVKDMEGDCFDCGPNELRSDVVNSGFDVSSLFQDNPTR